MTRRGTLWFGWTLALVVIAVFVRLGFWQYARMHEKQRILAYAAETLADRHAVPLWETLAQPSTDFAWVEGEGIVGAQTLLLDNQSRAGRPGVRLYCLLQPKTAMPTHAVLVDFGWLPIDGRRDLPQQRCPRGARRVRGLLARAPSSGLRMGAALQSIGEDRWLATRLDDAAIVQAWKLSTPLSPAVVRLDPDLPVGFERDLDILPNTLPPERHLGYAVQWWALALAVLATALVLTFRKSRT